MTGTEIDIVIGIETGGHTEMQSLTGNAGEAQVERSTASSLEMVSKVGRQIKVILKSLKRIKEGLLLA